MKNLTNKIAISATAIALGIASGCRTPSSLSHSASGIGPVKRQPATNEDVPYELTSANINGEEVYLDAGYLPGTESEVGLILYNSETTNRVIDENSNITELEPQQVYALQLARGKDGRVVTQINKVAQAEVRKIKNKGDITFRKVTEKDFPYHFESYELSAKNGANIGNFYIVGVPEKEKSEEGHLLNFYMVFREGEEAKSTRRIEKPDRSISLRGRIYRPTLIEGGPEEVKERNQAFRDARKYETQGKNTTDLAEKEYSFSEAARLYQLVGNKKRAEACADIAERNAEAFAKKQAKAAKEVKEKVEKEAKRLAKERLRQEKARKEEIEKLEQLKEKAAEEAEKRAAEQKAIQKNLTTIETSDQPLE
jgi:hypothetical protein